MKKPQYITIAIAAILVIIILAFGKITTQSKPQTAEADIQHSADDGHDHGTITLSVDTLIAISKKSLTPQQANRISLLENSITRGDVKKQQLEIYHQLTHFWRDTGKSFVPFAWYTAEAARLENSEKNLTFAAQLFLDQLQMEENQQLRQWMANQSKDLFERSLQLNPQNDSAKIGLGASYLYGGIGSPMEGIGKIREVADRDTTNVYAQLTLATASMISGQVDKAVQRLQTVLKLQPENLQALLMYGDIAEKQGDKKTAIAVYSRAAKIVKKADIKHELEKRIGELKK